MTGPTENQIHEQLERVFHSRGFVSSPRKQQFLRYIVEKTLAGQAERIKEYAIAIDVFGRSEDFDTQSDTVVRVQAGALRKALTLYYLKDGRSDPIKIEIKKGSYLPVFSLNTKAESPTISSASDLAAGTPSPETISTSPSADHIGANSQLPGRQKRRIGLIAVAILALLMISVTVFMRNSDTQNKAFAQAAHAPTGPSIGILRFDVVDADDSQDGEMDWLSLSAGLQIELVEKISRFQDIFVTKISNSDRATTSGPERVSSTDYILSGLITEAGDHLRIVSVLTRTSTGETLWTREVNQPVNDAQSIFNIQSDIAIEVAVSLGQPYSSVYKKYSGESAGNNALEMEHYLCLMRFYDYQNRNSKEGHFEVRACLEKATSARPAFSSGWAALSQLYLDEYYNRFNLRPKDTPPLERAAEAATRAVEADPQNAMAYRYLSMAKYVVGDDQEFKDAAAQALTLNPNDPEVLAMVGRYLIRYDGSEIGREMVEKAIKINPAHAFWYHGPLILYYYDQEETAIAMSHALEFYKTGSLPGYSLYTAVLVQNGQIEEAKQILELLLQKFPHFSKEYKTIIRSRRMKESMYTRLVADLETAGLTPVE